MKDIEFRVWNKTKNKILEISALSFDEEMFMPKNTNYQYFYNYNNKYYSELMQFTGEKDKNGTKIFEGDIISFKDEIGEVKYYEEMVGYEAVTNDGFIVGPHFKKSKVIGNIFENPELLRDV